ncbi:hypothetical protein MES5069_620010 [Mesorhizobium escarrei]|uniref:Class I SAM-dependent methyltransferase n=1 Tax=Mesorhizobium escarrei TaxID=666018 RepID=A0ABM9EFU8_9HYPH|nr:hypothetical protein MES5069_620010 [Mesorhizobium escarrei]
MQPSYCSTAPCAKTLLTALNDTGGMARVRASHAAARESFRSDYSVPRRQDHNGGEIRALRCANDRLSGCAWSARTDRFLLQSRASRCSDGKWHLTHKEAGPFDNCIRHLPSAHTHFIAEAVLEHVINPEQVVSEIRHRSCNKCMRGLMISRVSLS